MNSQSSDSDLRSPWWRAVNLVLHIGSALLTAVTAKSYQETLLMPRRVTDGWCRPRVVLGSGCTRRAADPLQVRSDRVRDTLGTGCQLGAGRCK